MRTLAEEEAHFAQQYDDSKCCHPHCSFIARTKLALKRHYQSLHPTWDPDTADRKSLN